MRSTKLLALAALMALPFGMTTAMAAPAAPGTGGAVSKSQTPSHVIDVRKGGGGGGGHGHGGHGHGGHGGHGHHGHGHHGHGHHGHGHHGHHHFNRGWYGVPYYGAYYPDYYLDDGFYEYDDGDDDAVVYAEGGDAVARCAARYRSFDRASGTFLSNDGTRKMCPYLR